MLTFSRFLLVSSLVSSSLARTFNVKVGADGIAFSPNVIIGAQGDEIIFEFHPKNHSLTQSSLAAPCSPLAGGGDSDYIAVATGSTSLPTKRLLIPDNKTPLWFYCKQANHCQQGMVFAVNPQDDAQLQTFINNAKGAAPATTPSSPAAPPASTSQPAATTGKVHEVAVGQGGLTFSPEKLEGAETGDVVRFTFYDGSHTVTQSAFIGPCLAIPTGIDSGPMPVQAGQTTNLPVFNYTIPDASFPTWFFCKTGRHCQSGMVFGINSSLQNTFEDFKALAQNDGVPLTRTTTQPGAPTGTEAASPGSTGKVHEVAVGQSGLQFTPEKLEGAQAGDQIRFTFFGGSHTVTQSTFADPCNPLANGADSGPSPVQAGQTTGLPVFTFNVTDVSKPLWFYCKTGAHCQSGMVLSVNSNAQQTHEQFKATAMGNNGASDGSGGNNGAPARNVGGAAMSLALAAAVAGLLL